MTAIEKVLSYIIVKHIHPRRLCEWSWRSSRQRQISW